MVWEENEVNTIQNDFKKKNDKKFDILGLVIYAFVLAIPFGMMDLFIRQLARQINYKSLLFLPSIIFFDLDYVFCVCPFVFQKNSWENCLCYMFWFVFSDIFD